MKKIELKNLTQHLKQSNFIGEGTEGRVYKISDEETIKLYYNQFRNILISDVRSIVSSMEEEASEMYEEKLTKLSNRKEIVKRTSLPRGSVTYKGLTVGAILKYHNNHKTFSSYYLSSPSTVLTSFEHICKSLEELTQNAIYPTDIHPSNILLENNSDRTELIDIEGEYVHVYDNFDKEKYELSYQKYRNMLVEYLKVTKSLLKYSDEEALDSLKIPSHINDLILSDNVNYEIMRATIDYLKTNKKVLAPPTLKLK